MHTSLHNVIIRKRTVKLLTSMVHSRFFGWWLQVKWIKRLSNLQWTHDGSALCQTKMALPFQRWNSWPASEYSVLSLSNNRSNITHCDFEYLSEWLLPNTNLQRSITKTSLAPPRGRVTHCCGLFWFATDFPLTAGCVQYKPCQFSAEHGSSLYLTLSRLSHLTVFHPRSSLDVMPLLLEVRWETLIYYTSPAVRGGRVTLQYTVYKCSLVANSTWRIFSEIDLFIDVCFFFAHLYFKLMVEKMVSMSDSESVVKMCFVWFFFSEFHCV